MSIIDDIQLILNLLQQHKTTSITPESVSYSSETNLDEQFHRFLEEYESLKNIVARASLVLLAARQELEESKLKSQQSQIQLESKKSELHSSQQFVEKLQQKMGLFEREEESLRDEINHLNLLLSQKQAEDEQRQEASRTQATHWQEQNSILQQHIEDIYVKYKNMELIAQKEARKRQKLQEENALLRKQQHQMEQIISSLNCKLNLELQARTALENEIKEREARVQDLEEQIDSGRQLMAELSTYEIRDGSIGIPQDESMEIPTDLKLLQLSQQISDNQKPYVNLNFLEQSFEAPLQQQNKLISNQVQQKLKELLAMNKDEDEGPSLRKVASTVQLSTRKKKAHKEIILRDLSDNDSQEPVSKDAKGCLNNISSRAENRLKGLYQIASNKVIIETQNTDRQCETDRSMLHEQQAFRRADSLISQCHTDPYYIHYQLTVQSIKIEEDEDGLFGILEIDMKPYYHELVECKLPLSRWSDWIKNKLLSLSSAEQEEAEGLLL